MSEEIQSPFAGKSILLAEDNIDSQDLMRDMLEVMQCHSDIANDGVEAVEKWKKKKYDLIIMDIQMPNMDGHQATIEIRKLEAGKSHVLILAITASVLADDRQKCFEAGMDDYLSKPVTFDIVKKKIHELFLKEGG